MGTHQEHIRNQRVQQCPLDRPDRERTAWDKELLAPSSLEPTEQVPVILRYLVPTEQVLTAPH